MIVMGALRGMDVGGVCVGKKKKGFRLGVQGVN